MSKEYIILVGGGGNCRSSIDVIELQDLYRIRGILDLPERVGQSVLGYPIIGTDDDLPEQVQKYRYFLVTYGQIKSSVKRRELFERLQALGVGLPTIVSPTALVSRHAELAAGTIVMHHAVVNAGARIGANCIINTGAIIEHDVVIGDTCHVSTAAIVNGGTRVANNTFIGSNSVTKEGIEIGSNSVIGAGVQVMEDIPAGTILVGGR